MASTMETFAIKMSSNPAYNSKSLKIYLVIAIPVIILLIYIVYKYNFSNRALNAIATMNYKDSLIPEQLPQCYELDPTMQYKLCDYYISASAMTPCIGNQHYDYVSLDMITEVLQSGARYIQIPICESDISMQALPVVGTAQYGQKLITSLNTLDIRPVLQTIRANAFTVGTRNANNKSTAVNYPLFVHFILNTTNTYTLNTLAKNIQESWKDIIIPIEKYQQFPIFLEKLCNLLGRIIIFATPEYKNTQMETWVIPTSKMFEKYHYSEIAKVSQGISSGGNGVFRFDTLYNNKLSTQEQTRSAARFRTKYPSLDYVIENRESIAETILNDSDILDNLASFNKVGMSLVYPNQPEDVLSSNYNIGDAVYNGCQFIAMNFQINDDNMKTYMEIFRNNSFRLKPGSMRFTESETPIKDLTALYQAITPKMDSIWNDAFAKYAYRPIILETFSIPNTYLTLSGDNLLGIAPGSASQIDRVGKRINKPGISQCFIISQSKITQGRENIALMLESASAPSQFITYDQQSGGFKVSNKGSKAAQLNNQSFYLEKSPRLEDTGNTENTNDIIQIRLIDGGGNSPNPDIKYIGVQNRKIKALGESSQIAMQNAIAFRVINPDFKIEIAFNTLFGGGVKTMSGGIVGILENAPDSATYYVLEPVNNITSGISGISNFNYMRDEFYMRGGNSNTYLEYDPTSGYVYNRLEKPSGNSVFKLMAKNGAFMIVNNRDETLAIFQNNILKFIPKDKILANENQFKIKIKYSLVN